MSIRCVAILSVLLVLAGCAETYGPAGSGRRLLLGGGYRDKQLSADIWEVQYSGAEYRWAYNSALYRAAEIAKTNAYPFFTIEGTNNSQAPAYSGNRYVGSMKYVTLTMHGWRAYEARCSGGNVIGTTRKCDLYDTGKTLDNLSN